MIALGPWLNYAAHISSRNLLEVAFYNFATKSHLKLHFFVLFNMLVWYMDFSSLLIINSWSLDICDFMTYWSTLCSSDVSQSGSKVSMNLWIYEIIAFLSFVFLWTLRLIYRFGMAYLFVCTFSSIKKSINHDFSNSRDHFHSLITFPRSL